MPRLRTLVLTGAALIIAGLVARWFLTPWNGKYTRYTVAMQSDLRNLATFESAYYATNRTYTADLAVEVDIDGGYTYWTSAGVTVRVERADSTGWSATASHGEVTRTCAMSVRRTSQAPVDTGAGPTCEKRWAYIPYDSARASWRAQWAADSTCCLAGGSGTAYRIRCRRDSAVTRVTSTPVELPACEMRP